jgi:hypothetical protein
MKILPLFIIIRLCHKKKPELVGFQSEKYFRPFWGVLISEDKEI